MRQIKNINIGQSILKKKLVFTESSRDKISRIGVYIYFTAIIVLLFTTLPQANPGNPNDVFFAFFLIPAAMLFSLYVIYRKATEKRLFRQNSPFEKEKKRQLILSYAGRMNLDVYRDSGDCIILNSSTEFPSAWSTKSMVFILCDKEVFYTILKENIRLDIPVLTSHLLLKYDMKKLFKIESKSS